MAGLTYADPPGAGAAPVGVKSWLKSQKRIELNLNRRTLVSSELHIEVH